MVLCLSKRHDYYKRYHKNHLDMRRNYFFSELYHDLSKLDLHATKFITIQLCRERCFFFLLSGAHYPPISWISGILQRAETQKGIFRNF